MTTESKDPFEMGQVDLDKIVAQSNQHFKEWLTLLYGSNTSQDDQFIQTTRQLKLDIKEMEISVQTLDQVNQLTRVNPTKYNLTKEIQLAREEYIQKAKDKLATIMGELTNPDNLSKIANDRSQYMNYQNRKHDYLNPDQLTLLVERELSAKRYKEYLKQKEMERTR